MRNTGDGDAPGVVVTDVLGSGFSDWGALPGSGGEGPTVVGPVITWVLTAPLAANGGAWTAQVTATVAATGVQTDTVQASGRCAAGCTYGTAADTAYVTLLTDFGKFPALQTATIGSLIVFTFTASLPDQSALYQTLTLTDALPTGLGYVSSRLVYTYNGPAAPTTLISATPTLTPGRLASGDVIWALGDLSGTVQVHGVLTAVVQDIPANGNGVRQTNALTMTYTDDGQLYVHTDTAEVEIVEPALHLSKEAASSTGSLTDLDGTALLTYTLRLTNTGTSPAYDLLITDAVPAGISVTALYGGDAHSGPVQGPGVLTWTVAVVSDALPGFNNPLVLTYTARVSGAIASGNEADEITRLTNRVSVTYASLPGAPWPGEARTYGPVTDTATVEVAAANVRKTVRPVSSSSAPLRIGDLVTYTIVDEVPPGLRLPWPYQFDYLPIGFRYITGTFAVTTNLPFAGSSLTDTLVPPYLSRSDSSPDLGVAGVTATVNPNVGPRYDDASQQAVEWWFQPLDNVGRTTVGLVTITFQAQIVGLDLQGTSVWTDALATASERNYVYLLWNVEDGGAYTDTLPVRDDYAWVAGTVGQPHLSIAKASQPPPGAYVRAYERITYTLTITNDGYGPAYDIVISDALPSGLVYVTSTLTGSAPPTIAFTTRPPVSATGTLTWGVNLLWGRGRNGGQPGVATLTMVAWISAVVGASARLTNTAAIPAYDSQPGDGPGPWSPDERSYTDGSDSVWHQTPPPYGVKYADPITATIGDTIVFSLVGPYIGSTLYDVLVTDVVDGRLTVLGSQAIGSGAPPITSHVSGQVVTGVWGSVPAWSYSALIITTTLDEPTAAAAGDRITNTASFQWAFWPGGPRQPVTSINVVTVTVVEPHLVLTKRAWPPREPVGAGDRVTYTLILTNEGTGPAYDLVITDRLPAGLTYVATEGFTVTAPPTAVRGGGYPTWTVSQLDVGGAVWITVTAQVAWGIGADLPLTNAGWGSYSSQPGPHPGERSYTVPTDTATVRTGLPVLTLTKAATPTPVEAGALLTYTLTVTSGGLVSATGVVVTDAVPLSTTYRACAPQPCGEAGGIVSWTLGTLDLGASRPVTLVVQVDPSLPRGTVLTNEAWVTSSEGVTDTDRVTTPVDRAADLVVVKQDTPDPVVPGTRLTYTLVVTNRGPSDAREVLVTDTLPSPVTFVTATRPVTVALPHLIWGLGDLIAGQARHLTVVVRVRPEATAPFTNAVVVTTTTSDRHPQDNRDEEPTTPLQPGLALVKTVRPGWAARGQLITYLLQITNTGQVYLDPLALTDTLPPDFHYVRSSGVPTDPDLITGSLLVWSDLGRLDPGASLTVAFAVTATPGITGTYINVATATGTTPAETLTDTDDVPVVIGDPAVVVDKGLVAYERDPIAPNHVTFTIRITNVGPSVVDVLPLFDRYDPTCLKFVTATPLPDEGADDGLLTWYDLTGPAPHGWGHNLVPGDAFLVTTVFTVVRDITTTVNTAIVTDARDVHDNPARGDDDSAVVNDVPTAVELRYFRATVEVGAVRLEWATAVEVDHYGFELYRQELGANAEATLLAFLPGQGGGGGRRYAYTDRAVLPGRRYRYWLVDVDTRGRRTVHPAVEVRVTEQAATHRLYLPLVLRQ